MPRTNKAGLDDLNSDIAHVREVLTKVPNPQHRYQLTMLLEMAAQQFIRLDEASTNQKKEVCDDNRKRDAS